MSYDLWMEDPDGQEISVPRHEEGGTYVKDGTTRPKLNITYNYSWYYYQFLDEEKGLRWLYGKSGQETVQRLNEAVFAIMADGVRKQYDDHCISQGDAPLDELQPWGYDEPMKDDDYWKPTPENAVKPLRQLASWCLYHPNAIWYGD